jgi:major membrane immunogen (membrane-anchored lipoprotein)
MTADPPITLVLVSIVAACLTAAFTVWFVIDGKIEKATRAARDKADAVASDFAKYQTHVAETYVSKQGLREVRDEIMSGVREIKESVAHLNERIDGVIGSTAPRPRAPRGQG